ncbi:MAG: DUF3575 domain-containing protein [Saprospiraceae bacterium]|nr:DUF3575 domain-containing protein [Saprospiraceae bacterium]
MKRIVLLFAGVFMLSMYTNAQTMAVKINPFGLLLGNLNAGFEYVLNEKASVEAGLSYFNVGATVGTDDDTRFTGVGAYAMYRYYFAKALDAPRGLYVAPRANFGSTKNSDTDLGVTTFSIGALFGHQWVWPKTGDAGFTLDLGIGVAYFNANADSGVEDFGLDGIGPAFRLAIGYAF